MEAQVGHQVIRGRESRRFLLIKRGESLADTVSKLLKKPDADWILVEWEEAKKKHYSIFKYQFFVHRFVTPNLPSSENPELNSEEGDRQYKLLLNRVLTKSPITSPVSANNPFLRITEQEMRTAIGRAASQHAITDGVRQGKTQWDPESLTNAIEATLARVVVRRRSAKPTGVLHPVKPIVRVGLKRPGGCKILISDLSELSRGMNASKPKTTTEQTSAGRRPASNDQTLATLSCGIGGHFRRMVFDKQIARILAQGDAKLDPNQVETLLSDTGDFYAPIAPTETTADASFGGTLESVCVTESPNKIAELEGKGAPRSPATVPDDGGTAKQVGAERSTEHAGINEPNYTLRQLFPEIFCEPSHVVQKKELIITVRVLLVKPFDDQTVGSMWLPEGTPEEVHTLKVHLLMRGVSAWGEMQCSLAGGTVKGKEAEFKLSAPEMLPDEHGKWNERMFELIRVNFYLGGRWCGEAQRIIELLRDEGVTPCDRIPIAGEPLWRRYVQAEPSAKPPDLLVRIQLYGANSFRWTMISPLLNFNTPDDECIQTLEKPERYVQDRFEWLAGRTSDGINRENILGACEELYRDTPRAFKKAYWELFRAARAGGSSRESSKTPVEFKTIQFISDEPCVPWELMTVVDRDVEPDVEPVMLSAEYQVGRWLADSSCVLRSRIEVSEFRVSTSTYSGIKDVDPLPWTAEERESLSKEPWNAEPLNLRLADIRNFLVQGSAQAIHFACHGDMDQAVPQRSKILLEDDLTNFRTTAVDRDAVRMGIGKHHPLVFLNACQLGAAGMVLSLGSGWPRAFLDIGASAFIGPLWSVQDESARDAATLFYAELSAGKSLGEALQMMKKKWLDGGSITFLAYALYGDPTAKVVRQPSKLSVQGVPRHDN
jgi:hypothetical protein